MASKDLQDIVEIGRIALECDGLVEIRREVLKCLKSAFGIEKSNFWMFRQYPYPHIDLNDVVYDDIEDEFITRYVRYYRKMDPYNRVIGANRSVCSLNSEELKGFTKGEYYNDFLSPQKIHHQLSVCLWAHGKLLAVLGMYRPKCSRPFSAREHSKAQAMAKYVSAGLERAILNQKVRKVEDVINAVCPDLPYNWVIVLDECLEPIYASGEALKALLGGEAQAAQETGAYFPLPEALRAKCREFSEAARKSTDPMSQAVITCDNGVCGQGISANIRSVRSSEDSRLLFIVVGDARAKSSEALKKSGLSRREMEIAGLICDGLKNREIGEKLFISEYTVENHLRSIYQKMDVSNRTSLVNRITFARNER